MGKSGTTKYPKMFNLPSPFNMESKRLNKLKKKGDKVAAEVLASMYDASLDEFKPHNWNFNPIYRPNYSARFYKNSNQSYSVSSFRLNNSFESIPSYPYQGFDSLDWFGFYFGNERLSRITYRRQINEKNSKIIGSYLSSIKNDSIKGIVTDFYGDALPGVNIIIDGTSIGTQTDFDGKYIIRAKKGEILVFRYLGYTNKEVSIGLNFNLTIKADSSNNFEIDEISIGDSLINILDTETIKKDTQYSFNG